MASAMSIASLYRGLVSSHVFCGACACRYSDIPSAHCISLRSGLRRLVRGCVPWMM